MDDNSLPPKNFALTAAIFEGALVFVAVGLGWLLNQPPLETFHWIPGGLMLGPLLALPMLAIVLVGIRWSFWPFSAIRRVVDEMLVPLFRQFTLGEMAIISLLAGLGEEMLFRGVFQASVARWTGGIGPGVPWHAGAASGWFALGVVAVLFGLVHSVNLGYALLAGLIGLYLGWIWMLSDNLAVPMAAHAVYDFLALVYLVKIRDCAGRADGADSAMQGKSNQ
jgi:hypothetical protein